MPESDITTWDAQRWQRLPVTATLFFQCQQIGVHGSAAGTTAQVHRSDHGLHVRFTCPLKEPPAACGPQKPVGDPDIYRNGEYVRVVMRRGSMKEQVHWTVTLDGQAISEFGDRRINDPASWDQQVEHHDDHWSATLHLPLDALGPQAPEALRFYLMRCTPDEGITSWPTPFGTWMHAHDQAFVPLDFTPLAPQALVSRCHDLYREVYEVCHSFPDDAADWHTRMAGLLAPGVAVDQCAHHVHARSSQWPKRHFMHLLDRADPMNIAPARIHEALDAQDHDDQNTLAQIAREWKTELLTRGEAMMMGAYVYRLGGNEDIARRVRESLALFIQRYPLSCGLQRLSPDGKWGSSLNIYTLGLANRAMYLLSSRAQQDNDLLLALLKRTHEVIHFGAQTVADAYHFNHSVNWADKVVEMAALFPELRAADDFLALGWHHMGNALDAQILPDGISQELCSGYNLVCYMRLTEGIVACEDSRLPIPAPIMKRAETMIEASTVHMLPNGAVAGFGDGPMGCNPEGYMEVGQQSIHRHLREAGHRFNRPDLLWLGTHGEEGTPPDFLNQAKRWAGVYTCRTGWTEHDCGLILDAGPLGRAHAHDDRLGFVYNYKQRCLLVDGHYDMQPARRVFTCGPTAHSTVCVDDYASDYIGRFHLWVNKKPQQERFEQHGAMHLLEAVHHLIHQTQAMAPITVHRRIITQLDRFICVIDHITGEGRHNIHSRLQMPRGQVVLEGNRFRTTTGQIDLAGMHLDDAPFEQDEGDWSGGPDQQVTLRWTRAAASLPLTQAVLLIPFEQGKLSMPRVNAMSLSADTCHLELCWPDSEKSILNWP